MHPLIALLVLAHPHSEATLVSSLTSASPAKPFKVALRIQMEPTWHTYWKNPGDSGIPPSISWKLPNGWKVGPIEWPTPQRLEEGGLVSYTYQHEVFLLTKLTPPPNAKPGKVELRGTATWLICQRGCLPASEPISLEIEIGNTRPNPTWASKLEAVQAAIPQKSNAKMRAESKGGYITLQVNNVKGNGFQFFPADETIEPAAPQPVTQTGGGFRIQL